MGTATPRPKNSGMNTGTETEDPGARDEDTNKEQH
jgi:hypothetical protein